MLDYKNFVHILIFFTTKDISTTIRVSTVPGDEIETDISKL